MTVSADLTRALRHMLPDAEIAVTRQTPWHSLTFSGAQICISVKVKGTDYAVAAERFVQMLPQHKFDVRGQLVADIAVLERVEGVDETRLLIAALVLED